GSAGSGSSAPNSTRRPRPGTGPKPRGTTAVSSAPWFSKMRSFAARYASKLPCRSRWSGSRLTSTATRGRSVRMSSSWKLESSQTTHASGGASTADSARPTLPATGARSIAPSSSDVVVLPLVPVTPTSGFGSSRPASSTSLQTGTLAARASGCSAGTPGLLTRTSAPASPPRSLSLPRVRSTRTTSTPCRSSSAAAACPERASPSTTARLIRGGRAAARPRRPRRRPRRPTRSAAAGRDRRRLARRRAGRGAGASTRRAAPPTGRARSHPRPSRCARGRRRAPRLRQPPRSRAEEAEVVAVVDREAAGAEDGGEDPEADHDLRLRPRLHLEVVVDRRHQEHPPPEVLEGEDLDHHRE